jgi:hypothetical protein
MSCVVGYNREGFPMLWDTTVEIFLRCGIQQWRFSSVVGYNNPPLWDTTENKLRMEDNFSCIVSHNLIGYVPLRDTKQEVFLHCIPQRRSISSVVSHIAKETSALYPTMQKVLRDTAEKNDTTQNKLF